MSIRFGFCVSLAMAGILGILGTKIESHDKILKVSFTPDSIPGYVTVPIITIIGAGFGLEIDKNKIL